jgi:hypothetical protein
MSEILQPLRFHTTSTERLHLRAAELNYKVITPLVMPSTSFIPFVIQESGHLAYGMTVTSCKLINYRTSVETEMVAYMSFAFGTDSIAESSTYIFHKGTTTFSAIGQGIYYLKLTTSNSTIYYSDLFMVGTYNTVMWEFHNTNTFGNLWMRPEYYKVYYRGFTDDKGEFDEYSEGYKDDDNFDFFSYQRKSKLRTVTMMGDSNTLDCLKMMSMCDSVYLTDDVSKRDLVKIAEVSTENKGGNYMNVIVKYRVIADSVISVNTNRITKVYDQEGVSISTPESGVYLGKDKVYLGDSKIVLK